jgi:hypothetical protein
VAYPSPAPPSQRSSAQAWEGFASYCLEKVEELKKLAAEQADHKLHRWYRRRRIWQRFPGLYEELHNKVRGSWDKEMWGNVSSGRRWAPGQGRCGGGGGIDGVAGGAGQLCSTRVLLPTDANERG